MKNSKTILICIGIGCGISLLLILSSLTIFPDEYFENDSDFTAHFVSNAIAFSTILLTVSFSWKYLKKIRNDRITLEPMEKIGILLQLALILLFFVPLLSFTINFIIAASLIIIGALLFNKSKSDLSLSFMFLGVGFYGIEFSTYLWY